MYVVHLTHSKKNLKEEFCLVIPKKLLLVIDYSQYLPLSQFSNCQDTKSVMQNPKMKCS